MVAKSHAHLAWTTASNGLGPERCLQVRGADQSWSCEDRFHVPGQQHVGGLFGVVD